MNENNFKIMFHYLYYKLYKATQKGSLKEIAEYAASMYFGGLIALNIFVMLGFLAKVGLLSMPYQNKHHAGISFIVCMLASGFYFLYNKRYQSIVEKYDSETKS